jgi:tRNA A-37 threonylcarbamoyl transferase component Bud32
MRDATPGPAGTAQIAGRLVCGRYRLLQPIGRGAMGIVWQGRDELLDRAVAVKEVRAATIAEDQTAYQRTLREAKAAARLNHPGVVTVFDVVEEDGRPWIVMELVAGRSLDRLLAEDGPLPPLQTARLGERLLSALSCAHTAGVLHRDVKPANVLLTADGEVVLTDFGIATHPGEAALTQAGMVMGTPGFTAPERIRGGAATTASDLWSLGATLYAAVEGRGPFDRCGGSAAINMAVASEAAPRAPSAGPLGPVIDALLRSEPDERPDAAVTAGLLAEAAAQAEAGPVAGDGPWLPGGYPAFADVREFPPLPPADLPTSANLPEFLDQPALPGLPRSRDVPGFLDQPAPPGMPAPGDTTGFAASADPVPQQPRGRRRVLVAAVTAAVLVAGVLAGWVAYSHLTGAASGPGRAQAGSGTAPASAAGGRAADRGASAADGAQGGRSGTAAALLPAGYQWFQVTAADTGTVAGFAIAAPATWQLTRQGPDSYLRPPSLGGHIEISAAAFTYLRPLREATYLQSLALREGLYPGYQLIALRPARLLGEPAAVWRFTWQDRGVSVSVVQLLASAGTTAGTQSYDLIAAAPSATFGRTTAIFRRMLPTFQPLP